MEYVIPWERTAERRGIRKGIKKGMEAGMEAGKKAEKKETALRMLGDGLPMETISKCTGLPPLEINKLMPVTHL